MFILKRPYHVVATLVMAGTNMQYPEGFDQPISFSAKTGYGRQELWKAIEAAVGNSSDVQGIHSFIAVK